MSSKKELKKQLDLLPPHVPVNIDPDLTRMHEEFHRSGDANEGVPYSYISVPGMNDAGRLISDLIHLQPTHLQTALEVWENLIFQTETNLLADWSKPVLSLLGTIYREHYPPDKIKHK